MANYRLNRSRVLKGLGSLALAFLLLWNRSSAQPLLAIGRPFKLVPQALPADAPPSYRAYSFIDTKFVMSGTVNAILYRRGRVYFYADLARGYRYTKRSQPIGTLLPSLVLVPPGGRISTVLFRGVYLNP
jgi:hypothetical protein